MPTLLDPNPDFGWPALLDPQGEIARTACPPLSDIFCVNQYAVPLKEGAALDSQTVSTLLYGEPVVWLEAEVASDSPRRCQSLIDGYQGYLDPKTAYALTDTPTHKVTVLSSHIYSAADIKSPVWQKLPFGATVSVSGNMETPRFLALSTGGFVLKQHVRPIPGFAADPVTAAQDFLGVPYLWGGRSADGIDCSGLVQVTLAHCGIRVLRDSGSQSKSVGTILPEGATPQRGDLAFFPGHVGWMIDESHLLHANATHMAVTIDALEDVIRWVANETDKPPFTGFRRLEPFSAQ